MIFCSYPHTSVWARPGWRLSFGPEDLNASHWKPEHKTLPFLALLNLLTLQHPESFQLQYPPPPTRTPLRIQMWLRVYSLSQEALSSRSLSVGLSRQATQVIRCCRAASWSHTDSGSERWPLNHPLPQACRIILTSTPPMSFQCSRTPALAVPLNIPSDSVSLVYFHTRASQQRTQERLRELEKGRSSDRCPLGGVQLPRTSFKLE